MKIRNFTQCQSQGDQLGYTKSIIFFSKCLNGAWCNDCHEFDNGNGDYFVNCCMKLFLLVIGLLALAVAGIAIKILVKKDGKFAGTCASNNPMLAEEGASCGMCGARPEEKCRKDELPLPG